MVEKKPTQSRPQSRGGDESLGQRPQTRKAPARRTTATSQRSQTTRRPAPSRSRPNTNNRAPQTRTTKRKPSNYTASRETLRVIPLGGLEEVGANMMAYEYGNDIIIVDAGFAFPDDTTPGIDYIIPDVKYLEERKKNIRAIFITHGHMDHIGALPYLLGKLGDPPIYTMTLSAAMIKKRLEEFHLANRAKLNAIDRDSVVPVGNFKVRFFGVNHNIADSVGLSIVTPVGQIIHTGDWKVDHTPINEKVTEFGKLARYSEEGVLALFSDSTNAISPGYSKSEKEIGKTIDRVFQNTKGRIVFTSFSSLIPRIQQVLDIAAKYNRKVVVTGFSMDKTIELALSLGYLKIQPKIMIKPGQMNRYRDNQICVLSTGGQGEERSQLARMSRGEHRFVKIKKGDTVVISASVIPGNERSVVAVIDNLIRQGADVIYKKILDIHTGGHAQQEELKLMIQLVQPKFFMPIHGELHMLSAHIKVAQSIGMTEDNCFLLGNGNVLEFNNKQQAKKLREKVQAGYVFVDGAGVGDVGEVVIRDRKTMAEDGMFVVIVTIDKHKCKLTQPPEILSRGFVYMKNNEDLLREVKHEIRKMVEGKGNGKRLADIGSLRQNMRDQIGDYLWRKTKRRPMVLPVIIEM